MYVSRNMQLAKEGGRESWQIKLYFPISPSANIYLSFQLIYLFAFVIMRDKVPVKCKRKMRRRMHLHAIPERRAWIVIHRVNISHATLSLCFRRPNWSLPVFVNFLILPPEYISIALIWYLNEKGRKKRDTKTGADQFWETRVIKRAYLAINIGSIPIVILC